jgi:hypothetical protein
LFSPTTLILALFLPTRELASQAFFKSALVMSPLDTWHPSSSVSPELESGALLSLDEAGQRVRLLPITD